MRLVFLLLFSVISISAQASPIEPGVSLELAKWRAARYSDVRYKLNLTLEKMSPVLKGTMEIRVNVSPGTQAPSPANAGSSGVTDVPIILDWRKIIGHEKSSTLSNIYLNEMLAVPLPDGISDLETPKFVESSDHFAFYGGVRMGENVIKLDFTSPILTSGSAITRYVDKEDGAEYIYSLFVPSDASTAFPVFDQPDLKARFTLEMEAPGGWKLVSNAAPDCTSGPEISPTPRPSTSPTTSKTVDPEFSKWLQNLDWQKIAKGCGKSASSIGYTYAEFEETKPISTYVFAFAAGPFERVSEPGAIATGFSGAKNPVAIAPGSDLSTSIYARKSQAAKFKPHAAEVFRLNREAVKYFEEYFDYKFPFPKYDLVLIPEFPFGGMEHAGATFLREAAIIFPQEPTKSDYISRANLIFHEAAHQWFGDTVTMRWFDDLWLKEGFATFMGYKALEKIMPEANAWKVFYERVKQAAYQTDSTKGTTPIYQEIKNLSAAKSAYGNIVYNKAPAFLRQAEFYLGEDKFQTAVRAFLKKHEFGNAGWEDLVTEFADADIAARLKATDDPSIIRRIEEDLRNNTKNCLQKWVIQRGLPKYRVTATEAGEVLEIFSVKQVLVSGNGPVWCQEIDVGVGYAKDTQPIFISFNSSGTATPHLVPLTFAFPGEIKFLLPNSMDRGYGVFLLDNKSRDYVLKNIGSEKDPFLRSMMWGALWDSVREGELDPKAFVELAIKQLGKSDAFTREPTRQPTKNVLNKAARSQTPITPEGVTPTGETDETTIQSLIGRVSTALNYYIPAPSTALANARASATSRPASDTRGSGVTKPPVLPKTQPAATADLRSRFEAVLLDRLQNAPTPGQRITFYRAFVANASTAEGREMLKQMLRQGSARENHPVAEAATPLVRKERSQDGRAGSPRSAVLLRTKDRFDIVTRLIILGDPDGMKLLADLEKTETSDDARRYAYAARAGIPTAENKAKYWNDFVNNKDISESWIEAAFGPWNSIRHADLTFPYLERALKELPNHKRSRKIFFVNGWLAAFIGGQQSEQALATVDRFLAENPNLDRDLRLKILENVDLIERAVRIRSRYK